MIHKELIEKVLNNIEKVMIGKRDIAELSMTALLARGLFCWKMSRVLGRR